MSQIKMNANNQVAESKQEAAYTEQEKLAIQNHLREQVLKRNIELNKNRVQNIDDDDGEDWNSDEGDDF